MLKIMGILCILAGSLGYGMYLCRRLFLHVQFLIECRQIILELLGQMEYIRLPFPVLLLQCAKGHREPFCDILSTAARQMEQMTEADAGKIWGDAVRSWQKELILTAEEAELFIDAGKVLPEAGSGHRAAELYISQLDDKIVQAAKERKEKQKVYQTVSLMSGIFLIILLI